MLPYVKAVPQRMGVFCFFPKYRRTCIVSWILKSQITVRKSVSLHQYSLEKVLKSKKDISNFMLIFADNFVLLHPV